MLALLLTVVLTGIGCVLWFMREAMRNERLAVREKLAEAYQGQLALVQQHAGARWQNWLAQLDSPHPDASHFAKVVGQGLADAVICFDDDGRVVYPRAPLPSGEPPSTEGAALQAELRRLVNAGENEDAIQFVIKRFADVTSPAADAQGRPVAPNSELLALELMARSNDSRQAAIAARLRNRLMDYDSTALAPAQRTFLMRELMRLAPGQEFPTLAAEELAARYLEAHPAPAREELLRRTELRDLWSVATPSRRVLALIATPALGARLTEMIGEPPVPEGVRVAAVPPGEEAASDAMLITSSLGPRLPGWRLALSLDHRTLFDTAAEQRVARHLLIGSIVIAAMSALAILAGRGFGRQVQLARLKNDLVANVSHELKTPLTAMRALVDTLLEPGSLAEKPTREYLQLLATENARLSRLIDNFLTFSRLEREKFNFHFTPLRPESVAEAAVAAFGERARSPGCTFESHVEDSLPPIHGDSDALITALLNLLDNAWKYSGDQKRIILRAEARNGSVHFAVEDNGAGLSRRESQAIFDRFHQADNRLSRAAGGCGLGLSIVRSIVEAHRGSVHVTSKPGLGSTFTIEIPASAKALP